MGDCPLFGFFNAGGSVVTYLVCSIQVEESSGMYFIQYRWERLGRL